MLLIDDCLYSLSQAAELEWEVLNTSTLKVESVDLLLSEGAHSTVERHVHVIPFLENIAFLLLLENLIANVVVSSSTCKLVHCFKVLDLVVLNSLLDWLSIVFFRLVSFRHVQGAEHVLVILEKLCLAIVVKTFILLFFNRVFLVLLIVSILMALLLKWHIQVSLQSKAHRELLGKNLRSGLF